MMSPRKRSFRLNEVDGEVVRFALYRFLIDTNYETTKTERALRPLAEKLAERLDNYEWRIEDERTTEN